MADYCWGLLCLELWLYGCVHVVINIGEFSEKLPISNINSSPICNDYFNGEN